METYPFPPSSPCVRSILLVDDDPDSAFLLKRDLQRVYPQAEIREIPSWAALQLVSETAPDLFVTAYRFQRITGCELIAEIRKAGIRFPIAMISSMPVFRSQALQAGADLFLSYEEARQMDFHLQAWARQRFPDASEELRRRVE